MSAGARILASGSPGEMRVALIEDGVLTEAWIERPGIVVSRVGDLQRGRISARAPAMGGAFVALAGGETGFLPDTEADVADARDRAQALAEGRILALRVTRAGQGGKGPRVTARVTASERAMVGAGPAPVLIARGPEATLRLARAYPGAAIETDDAALAARLRPILGARITLTHTLVFDDAIETVFSVCAAPDVPLPGGGRLLIHPTPGLTAIDVDAGGAGGGADVARRDLNSAAMLETARQIRMRNLGGAILLDPAGLSVRRRSALLEPLRAALARDPLAPRLIGLTGLGLVEIVRPRVHAPMHEVLGVDIPPWPASALTHGLAALRQAARDAAARPGVALALRAAPSVVAALEALPGALAAYEAGAGRALVLSPDAGLTPARWRLGDV